MIAESIKNTWKRIDEACRRCGRDRSEVTLLAVSKTFRADLVREAFACGLRDFGENYVQEAVRKKEELNDPGIRWHFIGHLQSNKVRYIIDWIDLVHAVDSVKVAGEINRRAERTGRTVDVLLEVNSTGEEQKYGVAPDDVVDFARSLESLKRIRVSGLMTMGFFLPDPEQSRPLYRRMRNLKDELSAISQENLEMSHLSMGMSGDFEVAIEEGATIVRVGTGIFGKRKAKVIQKDH